MRRATACWETSWPTPASTSGRPPATPAAGVFAVSPHPNPFNPATTVAYTIERPGHLRLRIYDARGAVVRDALDGHVEQSG